ncbi:MAG: DnaD domain protein [Clostridia bacterium]|nr:DnaD domain protein [Clostridia bacterium]
MAFCKFATEFMTKSYTVIDNLFFNRFLISTPPKHISIYLYGLYICEQLEELDLARFSQNMGYTQDEIIESFEYWQEQGIVRIVSDSPFQVQYLPIRNANENTRKYDKDKYTKFNKEIQSILSGRMITPNEYEEYYTLMEGFAIPDGRKLSPEALLMIVRYCAQNKGDNVGYRYILTVARDWANMGLITPEQVETHLEATSNASTSVNQILKALGSTKKSSIDELQLYLKWIELGFVDECILYVAKTLKKMGRANFEKLDKRLLKYYELHLLSSKEIADYEDNVDKIFNLARDINRTLGLYYEDVTNQIETYINPWLSLGYEPETLLSIAQDCFVIGKRTLNNLDEQIHYLFNQGIVSKKSYEQFTLSQRITKETIKTILKNLNIERNVTTLDIDFWNRWTNIWAFNLEIVDYAVSLAKAKGANLSYVNTILADWHSQHIFTLEQAKLASENYQVTKQTKTTNTTKITSRSYTKSENEELFNEFKEMDI